MMLGINHQNIFCEREDFEKFKDCLRKAKEDSGLKIPGYCLMDNHVHIVAIAGKEPIGTSFKRLGIRYASWYNRKYGRQGALFQDRFKSEPIEDDRYMLSVVRYVHLNPVKAGIRKNAREYEWSSYSDYVGKGDGLADTDAVLGIFSKNPAEQIRLFEEYTKEAGDEVFVDIGAVPCITDEAIREKMAGICGAANPGEFQALPTEERERAIRAMRKGGMSIRQIVRNTGVSFGIVRRIDGR